MQDNVKTQGRVGMVIQRIANLVDKPIDLDAPSKAKQKRDEEE